MKRYLLPLVLIVGALNSAPAFSQQQRIGPSTPMRVTHRVTPPTEPIGTSGASKTDVYHAMTSHSLPASVTVPGLDMINVLSTSASAAYQQSNGRSMHNIQVDPSNPNNIHALMQGTLIPTAEDSAGLYSRRLFYSFSADAGKTWTAPVVLGDKRTGYGDLLLYNRGGVYVPIVVGHTVTNAAASNAMVSVWMEKGAPGDGNFSQTVTNDQDVIWATGAISKDAKTLYVVASRQPATSADVDYLAFGSFSINEDGTTTWKGWGNPPGINDFDDRVGKSYGGEYRIRVADDGRIGVAWHNMVYPTVADVEPDMDLNLYYSESVDGGETWSNADIQTIMAVDYPDDGNYRWTPTGSFDFWFEGSNPRFTWVQIPERYDTAFIQPNNTVLMYWDPKSGNDPDTVATADATGTLSLRIPSTINFFSDPGGHKVANSLIAFPAVARFDQNQFAIFYTGYQSGYWQAVDTGRGDVVGPDTLVYSDIFYSLTRDGGKTWEDPQEFAINTGNPPYYDFRFPSTSDFNPKIQGTGGIAHILMEVDTAAGTILVNGDPGFDEEVFGHKAATFPTLGVNAHRSILGSLNVSQNYPNPFNSSSIIGFSITEPATVTLTVEDVMGNTVAPATSTRYSAGPHTMTFDGASLPAGVYRYTLRANGEVVSKTMTLLK